MKKLEDRCMDDYLLLKDHVYSYIVKQINQGELVAGKKVNESAISKSLNISRTPVREALIQLAADGVLENVPRRGFLIKELTKEEAKETYYIIGMLDGAAASLAMPLLTDEHMREMEFYIGSIDLAINTENFSMYDKMQEAFHNVYLDVCPNVSLVHLLRQTKKKFLVGIDHLGEVEFTKKKLTETNNEHRKMVELFKAGAATELELYLKEVHWDVKKAEIIPL